MPLFKPRRPPETKDSRAARLIALTTAGRPRWTPRDYAALASEGFGKNPIAYRCVRMIVEAAAAVPLTVFVGGKRADDHPLRRLRPGPQSRTGRSRPDGGVLRALCRWPGTATSKHPATTPRPSSTPCGPTG